MSPPRSFRWILPLLALAALPGCDPCFGTTACGPPQIDVQGLVVAHLTGAPLPGVRVVFRQQSGPALGSDSLEAVTDSLGRFHLKSRALETGRVGGRLLFIPPPPFQAFPYAVDVEMGALRVRNDTRFLGSWGIGPVPVPPRINYVGELYFRGTGEPIAGVQVELRRTAGVELQGGVATAVSGGDGRFYLRAQTAGGQQGELSADLNVRPAPPASPFTVAGVRLQTTIIDSDLRYLGRWGVGGQIAYQGELVWEDTYTPAAGVQVFFRRTGGIPLLVDTMTVVTGGDGRFHLRPRTTAAGVLEAELHVRAPNPANSFVITGVRLATHEDDQSRLIAVWPVRRP